MNINAGSSLGNRKYRWRQRRLRGHDGAETWLGVGHPHLQFGSLGRYRYRERQQEVPRSTPLSKLTRKYGPTVLHALNSPLLQRAWEHKILCGQKLRWTPRRSRRPSH